MSFYPTLPPGVSRMTHRRRARRGSAAWKGVLFVACVGAIIAAGLWVAAENREDDRMRSQLVLDQAAERDAYEFEIAQLRGTISDLEADTTRMSEDLRATLRDAETAGADISVVQATVGAQVGGQVTPTVTTDTTEAGAIRELLEVELHDSIFDAHLACPRVTPAAGPPVIGDCDVDIAMRIPITGAQVDLPDGRSFIVLESPDPRVELTIDRFEIIRNDAEPWLSIDFGGWAGVALGFVSGVVTALIFGG